jgi:drug/metabolite transporter (DMT)-like permease
MVQTGVSTVLSFCWSLIWDKPPVLRQQTLYSPRMAWVWVLCIGVLATGLAGHGFVYLIESMGPIGASFVTFGQIFVGVIVAVSFVGEWKAYRWWEIAISILGLLALAAGIFVGFLLDKKPKRIKEEEEEEDLEEKLKETGMPEGPDVITNVPDESHAAEL